MKKIISLLMVFVISFSFTFVQAAQQIKVEVNNRVVYFPDAQPYINSSNRTMVPIRCVSENLGCTVGWDASAQMVTITLNKKVITLVIGQGWALVNGIQTDFDTKACILNNRTYVPLRFVSETLGAKVSWDSANSIVYISTITNKEGIPDAYKINPATDIKYGSLTREKARLFENLVFDNLKVSDDGTITLSIPNYLPDGFAYGISCLITYSDGTFSNPIGTDAYDFTPINFKAKEPKAMWKDAGIGVEILNPRHDKSGSQGLDLLTGKITEDINTGF